MTVQGLTPLEEAPEPEGDDTEAGGGKPVDPVTEDDLEDADALEDDEDAEDEDSDEPDS